MALRSQGKTQAEAAAVVRVSRRTVDEWENESDVKNDNPFVPDYRVSIPRDRYEPIYKRAKKGESHVAIAADYKVTPRRATRKPSHAMRLGKAA